MADNSVLVTKLELNVADAIKSADSLAEHMDHVNSSADFSKSKAEFQNLASRVASSAKVIKAEIERILSAVKFDQITQNLQNLDTNVQRIVNNIDKYMGTMNGTLQKTDQVDFSQITGQLEQLQNELRQFATLTSSKAFLDGFKSEEIQKASLALRDYSTAMKNLSTLNVAGLNEVLNGGSNKVGLASLDFSSTVKQINSFAGAIDNLVNVDRKIATLQRAVEALGGVDFSKAVNGLDELSVKFANISDKAQETSAKVNGIDIKAQSAASLDNVYTTLRNISQLFVKELDIKTVGGKLDFKTWESPLVTIRTILEGLSEEFEDLRATIAQTGRDISKAFEAGNSNIQQTNSNVESTKKLLDAAKNSGSSLADIMKTFRQSIPTAKQTENLKGFEQVFTKAAESLKSLTGELVSFTAAEGSTAKNIAAMFENFDKVNATMGQMQSVVNNTAVAMANSTTQIGGHTKAAERARGKLKDLTEATNELGTTTRGLSIVESIEHVDNALRRLYAGLASVKDGTKYTVTLGADVANIASAMQRLAGSGAFEKLAEESKNAAVAVERTKVEIAEAVSTEDKANQDGKTLGLNPADIEAITKSIGKLKDTMQKVGNMISNIFAGTGMENFLKKKDEFESISSTIQKMSSSMGGNGNGNTFAFNDEQFAKFIDTLNSVSAATANARQSIEFLEELRTIMSEMFMVDTNDPTEGIVNLYSVLQNGQSVLQNIGDLLTRVFTDFTNLNDFSFQNSVLGMENFEAHLRNVKNESASLTITQEAADKIANSINRIGESSQGVTDYNQAIENTQNILTGIDGSIQRVGQTIPASFDPASFDPIIRTLEEIKQKMDAIGTSTQNVANGDVTALKEKFENLSDKSLKNVSSFFSSMGSAKTIKEFTADLQQLAKIDGSKINQLVDALTYLFGTANAQTGLTKYEQALLNIKVAVDDVTAAISKLKVQQGSGGSGNGNQTNTQKQAEAYRMLAERVRELSLRKKQLMTSDTDVDSQMKKEIEAREAVLRADIQRFETQIQGNTKLVAQLHVLRDRLTADENIKAGDIADTQKTKEAVKHLEAYYEAKKKLLTLDTTSADYARQVQIMNDEEAAINRLSAAIKSRTEYKEREAALDRQYETYRNRTTDEANKRASADATRTASERQKEYNALLKEFYSIQTRLAKYNFGIDNAKNDQEAVIRAEEINRLTERRGSILTQLEAYEANGITNASLEESLKEKLVQTESDLAARVHEKNDAEKQGLDITDKLLSRMLQMAKTMIVMRAIRYVWTEAKKYAQEYYDLLNEIRMVTGKSEEDADKLAVKYRAMAKDLKASSTEIAKAAVTYYRQGLGDEDVEKRLIATTKYAKIAGIEFDTAADIMTASLNTFGKSADLSAEQVTDVFIALGNAAGSSAEEIGTAMQRASASAEAAGVSFQWLGAYIATISEATRQSAESIGTAMTSIMSRLHAVRATGYNDEDDFNVNDVSKALKKIDVALLDSNGQWRDLTDIFQDVAKKWDTLDDKTRSYIATVMAGTRQQNYFLALMQDMAKGAEGGSRAFELFDTAMNSAGTTTDSYNIRLQSVTAAQDNMKRSLEGLYTLFLSSDTLKGFYNGVAGIADAITGAVKKLQGIKDVDFFNDMPERVSNMKKSVDTAQSLIDKYSLLKREYDLLTASGKDTTEVESEMQEVVAKLCQDVPSYREAIERAGLANDNFSGILDTVNGRLRDQKQLLREISAEQAWTSLTNAGGDNDILGNYITSANNANVYDPQLAAALERQKTIGGGRYSVSNYDTFDQWYDQILPVIDAYRNVGAMAPVNTPWEDVFDANSVLGNLIPFTNMDTSEWINGSKQEVRAAMAKAWDAQRNYKPATSDPTQLANLIYSALPSGMFGIDTSVYSQAEAEAIQQAIADDIASQNFQTRDQYLDYLRNGFQLKLGDMISGAVNGVDEAAIVQFFRDTYGEDSRWAGAYEKYAKELVDAGVNSDTLMQAYANGSKYGTAFDPLLFFLNPDKKEPVDQWLDPAIGAVTEFRNQFEDVTDNPDAFSAIDQLVLDMQKAGYTAEQIAETFMMLNHMDVSESDILGIFAPRDDGTVDSIAGLRELLGMEIPSGLEDWTTFLGLLTKDSNVTATDKLDFMRRLLADIGKVGSDGKVHLDDFVGSFNNLSKTAQTSLKNMISISDELWEKIISGEALSAEEAEEVTTAIENAQTKLRLESAEKKGTVFGGIAEAYDAIISGSSDATSSIDGVTGSAKSLKEQLEAIATLRSTSASVEDKNAAASVFGFSDASEVTDEWLALKTGDLTRQQAVLDSTIATLYGLLGVSEGDTERLTELASSDGPLAAIANWLLILIGYSEQINAENPFGALFGSILNDSDVTNDDLINYFNQLIESLADPENFAAFQALWNTMTDSAKKAFVDTLGLGQDFYNKMQSGAMTAAEATGQFTESLDVANFRKSSKYFDDIADAMDNIAKSTDKAAASMTAYNKVYSMADNWQKAMDQYDKVVKAGTNANKILYSDVSDIASLLGMSAQAVIQNWSDIPTWLNQYAQEGVDAIRMLNDNAFFEITGFADADFSPIQAGIISTQNMTADMIRLLQESGQWQLDTIDLNDVAWEWIANQDGSGHWEKRTATGKMQVLKPTGNNPFSRGGSHYSGNKQSSGGGGGSGGGKNDSKENSGKSAEQLFVERTEESIQRIADTMSQLNTIMGSWDSQGYLTAEIGALEDVNELLEQENDIYRTKIEEAEAWLPSLYAELNALSPNTEEYDKVLERINYIQQGIVDWTQALTENEAAIIANQKKIKDLQNQIRQLHIDLENEVLKAIEDRDKKIQDMLEARIDMENEIIEILKHQAELERDAIVEAIEAQIDALEREKDAIADLLEMRKKETEEEDKIAQLQAKEAQYARIIADPTRAKEAKALMEEIEKLRDEIAWDQAENESQAQQDSIDQQISSLEDYKEYVERYYEELLENPQNFIEEVNRILQMSSQDIIAWLQQNNEEYQKSTESTQESMTTSWTDTLNTMNGIITTHWDEVYEIIAQGQDYVINFLKENSAEYSAASKLQQEAYEDGWKEMFEDIRKAYEEMVAHLLDTSSFVSTVQSGISSGGGGSSGGSGGGSGGSGGGKTVNGWRVTWTNTSGNTTNTDFPVRFYNGDSNAAKAAAQTFANGHKGKLSSYAKGGMANFTGPAWLDGTKAAPERILSPVQTKLFETLVGSLQQMARISVAPMSAINTSSFGNTNNSTFGDINIHVDSLDRETDFDDLAEKVKESILDGMNRGRAVGGVSFR